jgi:hypothetical protein
MLPVSSADQFCPPVYDGFASFFNRQFVVVDRWAPKRVKGLKKRDTQRKENELSGLRQLGNASTRK